MHEKEKIIAPLCKTALGLSVTTLPHFNTDQFGTFSGEVKRVGTQLEVARAKAQAALKESGYTLALASEGSFESHPQIPFLAHNRELVLLLDTENQLEMVGQHVYYNTIARGQYVQSREELEEIVKAWNFPEQGIILRKQLQSQPVYKEITTIDKLYRTAETLFGQGWRSGCFVETDVRAHRCPARREAIAKATEDLIRTCLRTCPRCHTPGFAIIKTESGLPCATCGRPTAQPYAHHHYCQRCSYTSVEPAIDQKVADPGICDTCNP